MFSIHGSTCSIRIFSLEIARHLAADSLQIRAINYPRSAFVSVSRALSSRRSQARPEGGEEGGWSLLSKIDRGVTQRTKHQTHVFRGLRSDFPLLLPRPSRKEGRRRYSSSLTHTYFHVRRGPPRASPPANYKSLCTIMPAGRNPPPPPVPPFLLSVVPSERREIAVRDARGKFPAGVTSPLFS